MDTHDGDEGRAGTTAGAAPRVLVAFATRHGSTNAVAEAVAGALREGGLETDVRQIDGALGVTGYDAVVVGAPMIMGWHRDAERFVRRHRDALAALPVAVFITAASLTDTGESEIRGVPVAADPWLVKKPKAAGKLSRRERYATQSHYLGDVLDAAAPAKPVGAAFFGGSLDLATMNILEKLFVLLVVGATPGDGRHWDFIKEWGAAIAPRLRAAG